MSKRAKTKKLSRRFNRDYDKKLNDFRHEFTIHDDLYKTKDALEHAKAEVEAKVKVATKKATADKARSMALSTFGLSYGQVFKSQEVYCDLAVEAANKGLIKITKKQKARFKAYGVSRWSHTNNYALVNGSGTVGKSLGVVNVGDGHAPLSEVDKSSMRVAKRTSEVKLLSQYIDVITNGDNARDTPFSATAEAIRMHEASLNRMHAIMLTLTVPDCKKGQLEKSQRALADKVQKLWRAFYDAGRRDGGFNLISSQGDVCLDDDGNYDDTALGRFYKDRKGDDDVHFTDADLTSILDDNRIDWNDSVETYGAIATFETTLNKESIAKCLEENLYHPHCHMVIFTNDEVDVAASTALVFKKWRELNAKSKKFAPLYVSHKGFYIENAFNADDFDFENESASKVIAQSLVSAALEATKYATKPDSWVRLELCDDHNFAVEVFAELYNLQHHFTANRSYGLMNEAASYASNMQDFLNSIDFSKSDSRGTIDDDIMSDIVTQISDLAFNRKQKRCFLKHQRQLTLFEVLYFNRELVKGLFTNFNFKDFDAQSFIDYYRDSDDADDNAIADKFEKKLTNGNLANWIKVFKSWRQRHSKKDVLSKLEMDANTLHRRASAFDKNKKHFDSYLANKKADDIELLAKAIDFAFGLEFDKSNHTFSESFKGFEMFGYLPELAYKGANGVVKTTFGIFSGANDPVKNAMATLCDYGVDCIPRQVASYRKLSLLTGQMSKAIHDSGMHFNHASNDQIIALLKLVSYQERRGDTDAIDFDYFRECVAERTSSMSWSMMSNLTIKQQRVWFDAMASYMQACNALSLNRSSIAMIDAPVIYLGFEADSKMFGRKLIGMEKHTKFEKNDLTMRENPFADDTNQVKDRQGFMVSAAQTGGCLVG